MAEISANKRIAKNTLMLYFRQILIMGVSLYTVRVVLNTLGAVDYGIYNVVAGVVVLFSFLNNAMSSATQRYLNFEMGEGSVESVNNVFNTSLLLHIFIAILVLILSETIGLWFVSNKLNIPNERKFAAFWCYQFSVFVSVVNILRIPYYATIIAYERMRFFAFISIFEVILKLGSVYIIAILKFDSLIQYSFFLFLISILVNIAYICYCNNKYKTVKIKIYFNKKLFSEITSFSGWTLLTGFANVAKSQGTNIILNIYHGVIVNAALGIANQVNTAIYHFVSNFQTAYTPQVIKSYASNDIDRFRKLILQSIKISFILLSFLIIPFSINASFILTLWLKNVPEYTIPFVRFILLDSLINSFIGPLASGMQGIGKIKWYQIFISIFIFVNIPLAYLLVFFGYNPSYIFVLRIVLSVISLFWRIYYMKNKIYINPSIFILLLVKCMSIFSVSYLLSYLIYRITISYSGLSFLSSCIFSILINAVLFYFFLLVKNERKSINKIIMKMRSK